MQIKKKIWPEYFELIQKGEKTCEVRLADFKVNEGDILIFEEYDPKKKEYTGRKITKTVKKVVPFNPLKMHTPEEIKKYGFNIIEFKD